VANSLKTCSWYRIRLQAQNFFGLRAVIIGVTPPAQCKRNVHVEKRLTIRPATSRSHFCKLTFYSGHRARNNWIWTAGKTSWLEGRTRSRRDVRRPGVKIVLLFLRRSRDDILGVDTIKYVLSSVNRIPARPNNPQAKGEKSRLSSRLYKKAL
jgi:hypothetical protein